MVEVIGFKFSCILAGIYRTPRYNFERNFLFKLNILLGQILKKFTKVIIAGDININVLEESNSFRELELILKSHNMYYVVDFPTRVSKTKQSSIDNFLTNIVRSKVSVAGFITTLSDHDCQILDVSSFKDSINQSNVVHLFKRSFDNANMSTFNYFLSRETWNEVYQSSVGNKFDVFFSIFMHHFDACFPKNKSRQFLNKNNWINYELIQQKNDIVSDIKNQRNLYNNRNNVQDRLKLFKKHVHVAKQKYYDKIVKESNNVVKTTWSIIKKEVGKNDISNNNIFLDINDAVIQDPQVVSNVFNKYFTSIVDQQIIPNIMPNQSNSFETNHKDKTFYFKPITEHELEDIILNFENKLSAGFDEVPITVIKYSKDFLLKPLVHLINSSFICGCFPAKLKLSKVRPLSKSSAAHDISDYRPLSLQSSFSKLFERVVQIQLMDYLQSNSLFDSEQHGFRKGKSVITAAIEYIESVINSIDRGEKVIGVFMDLTKAFDSVSHSKLIISLQNLGIKGRALSWFESYLSGRKQFVEITYLNNKNHRTTYKSECLSMKHGVPQGSILGPLLFLCYIKGLPTLVNSTNSSMQIYADDINIKISGRSESEIEIMSFINLAEVSQYLNGKQLLLNSKKTKFVAFSAGRSKNNLTCSNIQVNGQCLDEVNNIKFLGLVVDNRLSWDGHVNYICSKIASGIYALKRMSYICSLDTLKSIYHSFIHSHIAFGICLYGSTSHYNMNKILVQQKCAVRIMSRLDWNVSAKPYFSKLDILTVFGQYIFDTVLYVHNNLSNIPKLGGPHQYSTRNRNAPLYLAHKLEIFRKKPSYSGIRFYNKLPSNIKNITNTNTFKKTVKKFILDKTLYSLEEYFA